MSGDASRMSFISYHSRGPSEVSFAGLDSFEDIRRGFEFGPNRPMFYPPPGAMNASGSGSGSGNSSWNSNNSFAAHKKFESIYSVASVSSFGSVLNSGAVEPFGDMQQTRPISDDISCQYLQQELWCRHRRNNSNISQSSLWHGMFPGTHPP